MTFTEKETQALVALLDTLRGALDISYNSPEAVIPFEPELTEMSEDLLDIMDDKGVLV